MNLSLKKAFLEKGVTQIEACMTIGMDPSKLSKIIKGWKKPTPNDRKVLSQYLGKAESELFLNRHGNSGPTMDQERR